MNNNVCQVKEELLCILDTRNCTAYYNGNFLSDVEWDLSDVIEKPKKAIQFAVSVVNASIPIGAYNINETNHILVLKNLTTNVVSTIVISAGNYTITQLIDTLIGNTPSEYTYTFLPLRNKIFITNSSAEFQVLSTTTMWEPLGLQRNTTQTSLTRTCLFPNCVNMSGLKCVNIHLDNVNTKSISSFTKTISTIIGNIPVDVNSSGVVSYNLSNAYEIPIPINSLDYINIGLRDDLGNYIQNNGIHWSITLKFSWIRESEFNSETINETMNRNRGKINIIQPKKIFTGIPNIFDSTKPKLEE
jgi:hypothetical protein